MRAYSPRGRLFKRACLFFFKKACLICVPGGASLHSGWKTGLLKMVQSKRASHAGGNQPISMFSQIIRDNYTWLHYRQRRARVAVKRLEQSVSPHDQSPHDQRSVSRRRRGHLARVMKLALIAAPVLASYSRTVVPNPFATLKLRAFSGCSEATTRLSTRVVSSD